MLSFLMARWAYGPTADQLRPTSPEISSPASHWEPLCVSSKKRLSRRLLMADPKESQHAGSPSSGKISENPPPPHFRFLGRPWISPLNQVFHYNPEISDLVLVDRLVSFLVFLLTFSLEFVNNLTVACWTRGMLVFEVWLTNYVFWATISFSRLISNSNAFIFYFDPWLLLNLSSQDVAAWRKWRHGISCLYYVADGT